MKKILLFVFLTMGIVQIQAQQQVPLRMNGTEYLFDRADQVEWQGVMYTAGELYDMLHPTLVSVSPNDIASMNAYFIAESNHNTLDMQEAKVNTELELGKYVEGLTIDNHITTINNTVVSDITTLANLRRGNYSGSNFIPSSTDYYNQNPNGYGIVIDNTYSPQPNYDYGYSNCSQPIPVHYCTYHYVYDSCGQHVAGWEHGVHVSDPNGPPLNWCSYHRTNDTCPNRQYFTTFQNGNQTYYNPQTYYSIGNNLKQNKIVTSFSRRN